MRFVRAALARIVGIFTKDRADDDLRAEMPEVRDVRTGAPALGGIAEYSAWYGTLQEPSASILVRCDA